MHPRSLTPSWAETFHDLQTATTVEELWGVLLDWHGIRGSSVWEEPYLLFMRFHRDDSTDAEVTAALLCTDYRWRKASHHLIDRLGNSGVLGHEQLDSLADWFMDDVFEVDIAPSDDPGPDDSASTVQRRIWPPLRRWAARHQVERLPSRWRNVIDAASALRSRDNVAAVAGVMDAAEHVVPDHRSVLASIGTSHGSGTVRLAALPVLASTAGVDAAVALARCDPSAKVRSWRPPGTSGTDLDVDTVPDTRPAAPPRPTGGQTSLFD